MSRARARKREQKLIRERFVKPSDKPHIKWSFLGKYFRCHNYSASGTGKTMRLAYEDWLFWQDFPF